METSSSLFVVDPKRDFTRRRKHLFGNTMMNVLLLEAGSLKDELFGLFGYTLNVPTVSSFVQARDKIRPDAFYTLFKRFNTNTHIPILYKGYRLLAIDGSVLPISNAIQDKETTIMKQNKTNVPFSAYHINTSYDLLEHTYDDVILQGQAQMNENGAFNTIVDKYHGTQAIFIGDRNYESFHSFVKVEKSKNKFLIRVKDIHSKTNVLRSLGPFEDKEFDVRIKRILTCKQTKKIREYPEIYKFVPKNQKFGFFGDGPYFEFACRVVRFKISDDTYESIVTNLDENEFSIEEIKELYHMRWGIETAYREIKYHLDLNTLHSKKKESHTAGNLCEINLVQFLQTNHKRHKNQGREETQIRTAVELCKSLSYHSIFLKRKEQENPAPY